MEPVWIDIPYVRDFPYPVDVAYAWLTDYQEDDPARAGAVVRERRVVERTPTRVVLEGRIELLGTSGQGRAVIALDPARHRWEADLLDGRGHFEYQLTPLAPDRTRLEVHYRIRVRRWRARLRLTLGRPLIRRELHRMWSGYAEAMRRELGAAPVRASA